MWNSPAADGVSEQTAGAVSVQNISSMVLSIILLRIGSISVKTVTVSRSLNRLS